MMMDLSWLMMMWPNEFDVAAVPLMMMGMQSYAPPTPNEYEALEALMVDDVDLIMSKCSIRDEKQRHNGSIAAIDYYDDGIHHHYYRRHHQLMLNVDWCP